MWERFASPKMSAMDFRTQASAAREASLDLVRMTRNGKDAALNAMADALAAAESSLLEANQADVAAARAPGTDEALIDRLMLNPERVQGMVQGLRDLASLPDPVGDVVRGWRLANGMKVTQTRVPFGVVGIIYEARPNVTADAAGISLKSGNAALLRGSSSALNTNRACVRALRSGLEAVGVDPNAVNLVEGGREVTTEMMEARGLVDVLIPRGGAGLINAVVNGAKIPVIETGTGNCHLFVDASADLKQAVDIMINAKTQRCSVCNALETLLVHKDVADEFLPEAIEALQEHDVVIHGDDFVQQISADVVPVKSEDYEGEWLTMDLSARVVEDLDEALAHIRRYSTGHSETIVTSDRAAADRFTGEVDAAVVLVNASSRFVDGGEFGFGAEIGISTQKLHARGPMGLQEMTSTKYIVEGDGQVRA